MYAIQAARESVYPRTHGEQSETTQSKRDNSGLSPYSRGTVPPNFNTRINVRFIPVLTGNSYSLHPACLVLPVYPRTHGEQEGVMTEYEINRGLSPYSRGTAGILRLYYLYLRFIPVLTGNSPQ